jgi:hypothetical protein
MRFPLDYGRERVPGELRFWTEQYLLQKSHFQFTVRGPDMQHLI